MSSLQKKLAAGTRYPSADAYPDGESPLFFVFTGRDARQVTQALRTGGEGDPVDCDSTFTGPLHDEKTVEGGVAIGVNKCAFFNQQVVRSYFESCRPRSALPDGCIEHGNEGDGYRLPTK